MPKTKISEYSATANSNTDVGGINIDEGCAPSGINDAIRTMMAQLKNFQTGTGSDSFNGPVGSTTASTGAFTTLTTSSTVTHNGGTANGVAYLNGSKVLTTGSALTFDGSNLGLGTSTAPGTNGGGVAIYKSDYPRLTFRNSTTGDTTSAGTQFAAVGLNFEIYNKQSGYIDFGTGNTSRMLLDSSGNLGLGVTPYSNGTFRYIDVGLYASFGQQIGGSSGVNIGWNAAGGTSVNTFNYKRSGDVARLLEIDTGGFKFSTAPSGTADNAISFTQAMTLDASSRLIVGATAVSGSNQVEIQTGLTNGLWVQTGSTSSSNFVADFRTGSNASVLALRADNTALVSGNLLVGATSLLSNSRGSFHAAVNGNAAEFKVATNGYGLVFFSAASAFVGSIAINSASVAYNTSSDYRLKENIAPMTGALAKVAALKPVTYTWKADGSAGEGFIAHELAEVCPAAVTGEKDDVDADGKPQYQGIDVSFLVGTLTAAIQEQQAIIEDMKTRLAAAGI